jgi:cell wall-associated NlpC family hydrolase
VPFATVARSWRSSDRRAALVVTAIAATAAVAGTLVALPSSAYAVGSKNTAAAAAAAQARLDALGVQADKAVEAFNQAQSKLDQVAAQAKAQQAAVTRAQQQLNTARAGIQALAAAEYEGASPSSALTYALSSDPAALLQKADLLAQVNRVQTASLTKVVNANRELQTTKTRADQALASQQAAAAQLAARKAAVEKAIKAQQSVADSLQAKLHQEQQAAAAAAAERAVQQRAASRATHRAAIVPHQQSTPRQQSTGGGPAPAPAPVAASGGAAAALKYAYAQLGKPYRFGGSGPGSFDCSGLTMRAWGAAGVSLSHSSVAQQHQGKRVSLSALQPGDLVFWGNPSYHVAIYIGGGRIIAAPHTGTVVQIQSIWGHPSMAVRP